MTKLIERLANWSHGDGFRTDRDVYAPGRLALATRLVEYARTSWLAGDVEYARYCLDHVTDGACDVEGVDLYEAGLAGFVRDVDGTIVAAYWVKDYTAMNLSTYASRMN